MNSFKLSEIVKIQSRFGRSVNLERDFYADVSLDGYVLTTTARQALARIAEGFADPKARALTLTGLYGSGKSTFALYAAKLLSCQSGSIEAEKLLKEKDFELWKRIFGEEKILFESNRVTTNLFPILVSGSREPLAKAILRGVKKSLPKIGNDHLQSIAGEIEQLETSAHVSGKQLLDLFSKIAKSASADAAPCGLLLIIDELGKLLEFVALRPSESDIFLLQELAEATRSFETPFFLVTILHQAFERYAERLGRREREEWMKVQGRFEDLPFQEPNEQILHVLRNAFQQNADSLHLREFQDYGAKLARKAFALGLCGNLKERDAVSILRDCLPLHPTVSLTLGHVFRRFGQNERSLFAFLTSNEPFGLNEFLDQARWTKEQRDLIRLDRVYDYLVSAFGSGLYTGVEGRKWAEIETALNRLTNATEVEIWLVKTIGLLRLLGDLGNLKSSGEVLEFALADDSVTPHEINHAIENLRHKSIIVERRFNNTFAIWEGSDVNLEERFREAEQQIDSAISLAESLMKNFRPRPLVAKRHSYETGTLRYFEVVYASASDSATINEQTSGVADGKIVFALAANHEEYEALIKKLEQNQISIDERTILAVPKDLTGLRESIWATACWRWVRANTPELETDRAARNELAAHLLNAEQKVTHWLNDLQNNASGKNCLWFWQGSKREEIQSGRALQEFLSNVCKTIFPHTPAIKNELINRRALSSAGTAARRALFEAMLASADKERLGIEGFPPQISMYFSLLQETTIHRQENGKYGFFPPSETADAGIVAVWQRIEDFLQETETARHTVAELFNVLQEPPFGLKTGILPILLCAILFYYDSEVALYERGNFLPKLTLPIFERMCRTPEAFTLQLCRIAGVRTQLLEKMSEVLLDKRNGAKQTDVLTIVRPLTRFALELDEYTRNTSRLSPTALGIRRALFSAREPDKLLFKQLPEACGFEPFAADDADSFTTVEEFSHKLHAGLAELKRAYEELLGEIEQMLASGFSLSETGQTGRLELQKRSHLIADFVASAKLKSFILRATDEELDLKIWLESIAALLAGKPPAVWHDDDLARFEIGLAEIVRSFASLESLAFERRRQLENSDKSPEELEFVRLSFTRMGEAEQERVVAIRPQEKEILEETEKLILAAFDNSGLNGNLEKHLMVLANLSLKMMKQSE
ncbi:MAG TPA: hypothetical protein VF571_20370 [Pyrinomonadaceae bacterium]|jgi:hypothetical protein